MSKLKILSISNFISVILIITINSLANIIPFNGKYTGELSDQIPNLFVPSGITFSIWGVIYFLLICFGIFQILNIFSKKEINNFDYINKIGYIFILSCIANIIWIFLWHYEQVLLSLFFMIILLLSLISIYLRLNIGKSNIKFKEKIFIHIPFSIYLGWITVATIANITAILVKLNVGQLFLGEDIWTILMIIIAGLLTIIILMKRKDIAYSLVIIWALLGIALKRFSDDPIYGIKTNIAYTSIIIIIIILIGIFILSFYSKIKNKKISR
jgi:hypothetical protein